ncbi:MAG: NAD-dependent epimerase/dehydratase family protein [Actinomycetota bacterium]|jgi:dihydroflavonol-4-reductase|nr:NAD-dependent epimerase/dehydratase family protein [Actinomycetota bacterium]
MKIFMTGATGFIGGATARHLVEQGHQLTCVVRDRSKATVLEALGCDLVDGDLSSRPRLTEQMTGHDALLHNAALYEVGIPKERIPVLRKANVEGTANVLEAALEAGIPRVLYVSTCAVFGNTHRDVATEDFRRPDLDSPGGLEFTSVYEETKYEAHQIAKNLIRTRNLPCVIAQPAGVYGPEDHSELGSTIHQFVKGKLPMVPFPDFGTGLTHVEDIAAGLALILDKGEIGESYILNEGNFTMREVLESVGSIAGRKVPKRNMPTPLLKALRPIGPLVGKIMDQPPNLAELISSTDGVTFWADASKAKNELGWRPRDLQSGMRQTLEAEGLAA